jgi:hypothetical protein
MNNHTGKKVLIINPNTHGSLMLHLNKSRGPCKFFNTKAGCRFGNDCLFSHDITPNTSNGTPVCRFFGTQSGCKFGNKCRFLHVLAEKPDVSSQLLYIHDLETIINKEHDFAIQSVASNRYNLLVTTTDGKVYVFSNEQLEQGYPFLEKLQPIKTYDYTNQNVHFKQACTNSDLFIGVFTLLLTDKGKCYSFGANAFGQLGHADHSDQTLPKLIKSNSFDKLTLKQVCCGGGHSLYLTDDGTIFVSGLNEQGQLGLNAHLDYRRHSPVDIEMKNYMEPGDTAVKIQCGHDHCLVLTAFGHVYGFGRNNRGQIGLKGAGPRVNAPKRINLPLIADISSVSNHSLFITRDGALYACGENTFGQIPNQGALVRNVLEPVLINLSGMGKIATVVTGEFCTLIVSTENELYYCGTDMFGLETSTQSGADTYNIYNPVKLYVKELNDRGWKIDNITSGGKHLTVTLKRRSNIKQFQSALLLTSTSGTLADVIVYN